MTVVDERLRVPAAAELTKSVEVYLQVMEQAVPLGPFRGEGPSETYDRLYEAVRPVSLKPMPVDVGGHQLWNSDQTGQRGGAYKIRGSAHAILKALEENPNITDISMASAGNAVSGAAEARDVFASWLGRRLGVHAECTRGASPTKLGNLGHKGVEVHQDYDTFDEARAGSRRRADVMLDAYDAIETIAGQATVGWETLFDLMGQASTGKLNLHESPIKLFVPVGGGGLISGIACVMRWAKEQGIVGDNVQVVGVQMEGCDAMKRYRDSVLAGKTPPENLFATGLRFNPAADGTAVEVPGELTRAICCDPDFVADIISVSEGALGVAMDAATGFHGYEIEPAGALSLAGAQWYASLHPVRPDHHLYPETLITFTTGANVSPDLYEYFTAKAAWHRRPEQQRAELRRLYALGGIGIDGPDGVLYPPKVVLGWESDNAKSLRVISSPARS